jgi:hypothetical protein
LSAATSTRFVARVETRAYGTESTKGLGQHSAKLFAFTACRADLTTSLDEFAAAFLEQYLAVSVSQEE